MKTECVYKIQDNYIDLSQIKTFKLAHRYSGDKDKKRIEIILKDRIHFVNGDRNDIETISDTIDIVFENELSAMKACKELNDEWEQFIRENMQR